MKNKAGATRSNRGTVVIGAPVQAEAPSRPIAGSFAGPGLLAHVLVSRYCDHSPLYRQEEMYARKGVEPDRSTLAGWVGATSQLIEPLVEALRRHVMSAEKLHADDTPIPVLAPENGKTSIGRLWTYVRDDRPAADLSPPAAWFAYTPDRKGDWLRSAGPCPLWYGGAIMMAKTQITLETEMQRGARQRANDLGVSLAEYFRRLVARDLSRPETAAYVHPVFDLGSSGGSDIASQKHSMIAQAFKSRRRKLRRR